MRLVFWGRSAGQTVSPELHHTLQSPLSLYVFKGNLPKRIGGRASLAIKVGGTERGGRSKDIGRYPSWYMLQPPRHSRAPLEQKAHLVMQELSAQAPSSTDASNCGAGSGVRTRIWCGAEVPMKLS